MNNLVSISCANALKKIAMHFAITQKSSVENSKLCTLLVLVLKILLFPSLSFDSVRDIIVPQLTCECRGSFYDPVWRVGIEFR